MGGKVERQDVVCVVIIKELGRVRGSIKREEKMDTKVNSSVVESA